MTHNYAIGQAEPLTYEEMREAAELCKPVKERAAKYLTVEECLELAERKIRERQEE